MKITCQSCQSKYNVADEKVQGKIVKIRCRKCGGTIVVNATAGSSASSTNGARATDEAAGATVPAGGVAGEWHVNLGDTDQRTMSMSELVAAYNAGQITQDTFIWTDGMDDWRPLAEIDAVVSALHASAGQGDSAQAAAYEPPAAAYQPEPAAAAYEPAPAPAPVAAYQPPAAPAYEAPAADYAASYAAQAAPAVEAKRAAVVKREARGRDLFSTHSGEELQTSAPAASDIMGQPVDDGKLTGQRNENSVLFSLAVLTKNAEDRAPGDQPAAKDDSGMIDLKALVAKAESTRPAARAEGDVFAPPLGFAPPPITAPLGPLGVAGAEPQGKSKLPLLIGAGAGVALLLVLGIVIGAKLAGAGSAPAATVTAAATIPAPSVTASAEATASAAPDPGASAAPSASMATTTPQKPKSGGGTWHPPSGGAKAPAGANASPPATGAAALPPSPSPKKGGGGDCGCNGDLMCLMKCSTH